MKEELTQKEKVEELFTKEQVLLAINIARYDEEIEGLRYPIYKYTEQEIIDIVKNTTSSQTEISDEEIEREASHYIGINGSYSFTMAIKWYREQLKSKK